MQEWRATEPVQSFAYEIRGNSAVILRCFSHDEKAEIPEMLGGCPVTELAPYAFSAHFDEEGLMRALRTGQAELYVPEALRSALRERNTAETGQDSIQESVTAGTAGGAEILPAPALCGDRLEEIILPETLRRAGRYCFYNCGNLRRIEFHGALSDWGSGVFTGCHHVRSLRVFPDEQGQSHLKDVLDELHEEVTVEYMVKGDTAEKAAGRDPEQQEACRKAVPLVFPEFYEEGVENTPARILETHVHGSGILYRNCFQSRRFDFARYDVLFVYAKAQEHADLTARMAFYRLRFPHGLTEPARAQYEVYVQEHACRIGTLLLEQHDLPGLRFLTDLVRPGTEGRGADMKPYQDRAGNALRFCAESMPEQGTAQSSGPETAAEPGRSAYHAFRRDLLETASRMHYMEAVSFLMEQDHADGERRRAGRRRLEL